MKPLAAALLLLCLPLCAQTTPAPDPFQPLAFLTGTWDASTGQGSSGATVIGTYAFQFELAHHILARHSTSVAACKGPVTFDCEHGDLLYIYPEAPGQPLKAIYFDNEGHVIHYNVSTPDPATAVFLSDATQPGPQFRLVYQLKAAIMSGKFQIRMPGQSDWTSYLEWSGAKT
jgi:hypothetical protein